MISSIYSLLTAFLISLMLASPIITIIKKLNGGQNILGYVDMHKNKQGTPTMGGFIFFSGFLISSLIFINGNFKSAIVTILISLGFFLIGFIDDFIKIKFKHNEGLKPYQKIIGQFGLAIILSVCAFYFGYYNVFIPFFGYTINFGYFIIPFVIFVVIAVTNSVNLTDGLDGLAGGISFLFIFSMLTIIYLLSFKLSGNILSESTNLMILCGAMCGGLLAFLIFNYNPAKVFMGDCGSLGLGGFISCVAVFSGTELFIPIIGITFVASAISDIIQVLYYKKTKKRIFLMAPLHHHFEKKGIKETRIVISYYIVTLLMGVICVLTI